jgi:glycogen debranching enzyme
LLGLIDAGYFELSEDILTNYAEQGLPGKINIGSDNREDSADTDTYPLFIIAADKLERHFRTNDKIEDAREKAISELEIDEDGVVKHSPDGTWMDTLERKKAVDIQSLWLRAAEIEGLDEEEELRSGLEKFEDENYVQDNLGKKNSETINPAVPLMFEQFNQEEGSNYLEKINAEFSSRFGARTRSVTDPGYSADGYHTGSAWGLTTGWAAAANLAYGNKTQGKNFLEKMTQFLDRNQLGALPEIVDSETGELLGCSEQAWSAGLVVHVVDSHLLGIEVENPNKIIVDPADGVNGVRTGKKVGENKIDLKIEDGDPEVLNNPDMEVVLK